MFIIARAFLCDHVKLQEFSMKINGLNSDLNSAG